MQPAPVLTVTLNPALDLSAHVSQMIAGPKLRLSDPVTEPGGGGVNVARVIHGLGGKVCAWVALGGAAGARLATLLRAQGVAVHVFDAPGDTRSNWAITDDTGAQYRLQLPGADWPEGLGAAALADIAARAQGLVVLSGSLPPGLPARFPAELARTLPPGRLALDTSGAGLEHVVQNPDPTLFLLRMDRAEAEGLAGHALPDLASAAGFAKSLQGRGVAQWVSVACGAQGNVIAGPEDAVHTCRPPIVPVTSAVGAGDSFMGALVLALAEGRAMPEALRQGTAAAAAAVMTPASALCRPEDVARLAPQCVLDS
ncbi:1-phosphofructokinase family hexose kinase [Roseibaca sp. Y0-43]|uniref:1-phosphofructokinase family hexose kinase n=1 Tax=Roseibaca sp. Y0-43 TaxID=2816854 RepID=UPI001D0CA647|nr:PfkB family carbohydrate kinase [Roseibaca sp. Y0-43]MCC1481644.1 1-phosphofructokinase family hexose kinase [Roseibaca sp. Y0-43]